MANPDPTGTREYQEQRKRYEKRKAAGHWTGKTKAQRKKEAAARKKKKQGTVAKGIARAARQGRELDELIEELKR